MAGGVLMNGVPIQGYYVSDGPANDDGSPVIPIHKMKYELFKSSELLKSKRIYFNGHWFNFSEIIKFCANKYGGVHLDKKYSKSWEQELENASNYFVAGNPDDYNELKTIEPYSAKHQILLTLPKEKGHIWNCLDIELLAAANALINIHVNGDRILQYEVIPQIKLSLIARLWKALKLK